MKYRDFGKTGERVSALGFGCMRLPVSDKDNSASIIEEEAVGMLRYAIDSGVNYLDTAFFYHSQQSEVTVGNALRDGYREKVLLATKSPIGDIKDAEDFRRRLGVQLERLRADTIDCYLFHCIMQGSWEEPVLSENLIAEMERAKAEGKIRYIGFSYHDNAEFFKTVCDAYDWDFCQIQLNYIDVNNQAGLEGAQYAAAKGMAVIAMEPLLGGKLANLPENVAKALPEGRGQVKAALDFLWNHPEISLVLSGMSSMEQVKENLAYAEASDAVRFTEEELAMFAAAKEIFENSAMVSCTACEYCLPCPQGVNIPAIFKQYNLGVHSMKAAKERYAKIEGKASGCIKCGVCEDKCPQHIEISRVLEEAEKVLL